MTSYRQMLLEQADPLEAHEIGTLEEWLRVLRDDVAAFGPTPEDEARMDAIARRIEAEGVPQSPSRG